MIVSPRVKQKFDNQLPYVEVLYKNVRETLFNYCSRYGFAFSDRIKALDSLSEKIETGRYKKWAELDDFYASTIIIPNLNKEKEVLSFLRKTFIQQALTKRGSTLKAPDVFRFDNPRFIGTINNPQLSEELKSIRFEVQIKTAFEHAWSVATHSLVYKSNDIDWKLLRIAAQLKSSVEQLDMIVSGAQQINSHIIEHSWPEVSAKKYILKSVNEFLTNPNVPEEIKPKDSSRFSENLFSFFSPLIQQNSKKPSKVLLPFFERANTYANTLGKGKFPRSISLIQFFIGIATDLNYNSDDGKYIPLITQEMEDIFPSIKNVKKRFEIN